MATIADPGEVTEAPETAGNVIQLRGPGSLALALADRQRRREIQAARAEIEAADRAAASRLAQRLF